MERLHRGVQDRNSNLRCNSRPLASQEGNVKRLYIGHHYHGSQQVVEGGTIGRERLLPGVQECYGGAGTLDVNRSAHEC